MSRTWKLSEVYLTKNFQVRVRTTFASVAFQVVSNIITKEVLTLQVEKATFPGENVTFPVVRPPKRSYVDLYSRIFPRFSIKRCFALYNIWCFEFFGYTCLFGLCLSLYHQSRYSVYVWIIMFPGTRFIAYNLTYLCFFYK